MAFKPKLSKRNVGKITRQKSQKVIESKKIPEIPVPKWVGWLKPSHIGCYTVSNSAPYEIFRVNIYYNGFDNESKACYAL